MNRISLFIIITIIVAAFGIRIYSLSEIPPGLNRDEASIGYTVYSLLFTGTDEYGNPFPLSFKSFGDWKLPLYFYLSLPIVALIGLTEQSTRLLSVLAGTASVGLTYLLVRQLLSDSSLSVLWSSPILKDRWREITAILSAGILAISPWHVFMSRNASESNVAVFLVLASLCLFFKSTSSPRLIWGSYFLLALSLYTYHGNHIFTPILFIGLYVMYRQNLIKNKSFWPAVVFFCIIAGLIYSQTLLRADRTKISGLFPLADEAKIYEKITLRRLEYVNQSVLTKLLHNKAVYLVTTVFTNYLRGLSPEFLFISGGANKQHNIPDFGNLYLWEAFIWPAAFVAILKSKSRHGYFLLFWLLISPIAGSITEDAPHTNRMMPVLPLPAILTALGLTFILGNVKRRAFMIVTSVFIVGVIGVNLVKYLDQYFVHFPYVSARDWGSMWRRVVASVNHAEGKYVETVISRPDVSPYIYFLFYRKINPIDFQKKVIRYPETAEGFHHVKQYGKLKFEKINWTDELLLPNRLYVDFVESVPSGATQSAILITADELIRLRSQNIDTSQLQLGDVVTSRLVDEVRLPNASPFIYLIETKIGTPSGTLE